jgi:hypothetical protein
MSRRDSHAERIERTKLLYDLNKHITTLSAGTLLLMAGLFDKVFKSPIWKLLAGGAAICFAAAITCCVVAMLGFAMYSRETFGTEKDPFQLAAHAFITALIAFILGVIAFTIFALRNI